MYILVLFLLIGLYLSCLIVAEKSTFKPNKYKEIYDIWWCHRGFTACYTENSLESFKDIIKASVNTDRKLGIEVDIRFLKDDNIVCFHDRFTKRLLNIPGSIYDLKYKELKKAGVCHFNELLCICENVPILIDVKGNLSSKYIKTIKKSLYEHNFYFHTDSIVKYIKLRRTFGKERVFAKFNIFAMRFNFVKFNKKCIEKSNTFLDIVEDVSGVLVNQIDKSKTIKNFCLSMNSLINNYQTRVKDDHWLINSLIIHRGVISSEYPENSIESIRKCIEYSIEEKLRVGIELDIVLYKGELRCYHSDKISSKLGQEASCADKIPIEESMRLSEVLEVFQEYPHRFIKHVSFVFDLKSYKLHDRTFERMFYETMKDFKYNFCVQSFNPLSLMWFEKNAPEIIRGQIGHSISGLTKYLPNTPAFMLSKIVNILLFNNSHADYCVYDNSNFIYIFMKYNKDIKGRPVFVYAPQSYDEIVYTIGREYIVNYILENVKKWPEEYKKKYSYNDVLEKCHFKLGHFKETLD